MESRRPNEVVVARCRLELRYSGGATPGPGLPEKFVLDPEVTTFYEVGRMPADGRKYKLTLGSAQQPLIISRNHARFEYVFAGQQSDWVLTDLVSTNGCQWNGVRVQETKLSDGDTITFGGCGSGNSHLKTEIGEKPFEKQPKSIYTYTVHCIDGGGASASGASACRAPLNSRASSPGRR